MITKAFDIPTARDIVLEGGKNAKKSCAHITQVNTSNKILLGITQGIGNAVLATPLIKALTSMNMKVDILSEGLIRGAEKVFKGMDNVKVLKETEIGGRIYLLGLQTMWPYNGLETKVAQIRFAPNIHEVWKAGIPAHEVDINMSLAYSLKYTGEIPEPYCHHTEIPGEWDVSLRDKKNVGIHVCRSYNHQFHANRQLLGPLVLGRKLLEEGYRVFIIGHKGAVTERQLEDNQDFVYCLGTDLSDVAGLIKEIDCMVNEDSGIMHVTAAMDTPQVAIFGPTSDIKNKPWSNRAVLVQRSMDCQPCQYTERANNCYKNECMNIDHDYIVKIVNTQIEKYS
jgi:ADP-heptose:LPS heptosyltransferase